MALDVDDFLFAQAGRIPGCASYDVALAELRAGRKRTHWIWYVFPIEAGRRPSSMAKRFALAGHDEAMAYLRHPVLRARLIDAVDAVATHTRAGERLDVVMGDPVDAQKLVWCLELFAPAARALAAMERDDALEAFARACDATKLLPPR